MAQKSVRLRRFGLATMLLSAPLSGFSTTGPTPLLPLIEEHFGLADAQASLVRMVITAVTVAMVVGSSLGGFLGERFGVRRVYLISLVLFAVLGVACAYAPNIYWMIGLRFVFGLAAACASVLALAMTMANFEGAARDRWTGIYVAAATIGTMIIIPLFGWLGDKHWQTAFYLHLVTLLLAAFGARGIAPDTGDHAPVKIKRGTEAKTARPLRLIFISLLTGICGTSGLLFLPFHLRTATGASPAEISAAVVVVLIATTLFSSFYATIRRYLEMRTVQIVGFLLLASGYLIGGASSTMAPIFAAQLLVGAGIGLVMPSLYLLANLIAPKELQSRFTGIARATCFAGPLVGQVPLEPIAAWGGPGAALIGLGGFAVGVALLIKLLPGSYFHKPSVTS